MLVVEQWGLRTADLGLLLAAGVLAWPVAVMASVVVEIARHLRSESP